jgi:cytochrome c
MRMGTPARIAAIGFALLSAGGSAIAEDGDAARGQRIFQYCFSCHSVDPNEQTPLEGPSLYHILGRPTASLPDFNYSDAMKKRGAEGLKWDAPTLNAYIADPQTIVPGTRMSAAPLRDEQARADLIAYLAKSGAYRPQ